MTVNRTLSHADIHNQILPVTGPSVKVGYDFGAIDTSMTNEWKVYKVVSTQPVWVQGIIAYFSGGFPEHAPTYMAKLAVWYDEDGVPGRLWNDFGQVNGGFPTWQGSTQGMPKYLAPGTYWIGANEPSYDAAYIGNDGDVSGEVYGAFYPFSSPAPDPYPPAWIHVFAFHLHIYLYGIIATEYTSRIRIVLRSIFQCLRLGLKFLLGYDKPGTGTYFLETGPSTMVGYNTGDIEHTNVNEWKCVKVTLTESVEVESCTINGKAILPWENGLVRIAVWRDNGSGIRPFDLWNDFGAVTVTTTRSEQTSTINMPKIMFAGTYWLGSTTEPYDPTRPQLGSRTETYYAVDANSTTCGGHNPWGPAPNPFPAPWFVGTGAHMYQYLTVKLLRGIRGRRYIASDDGSISQWNMSFYNHSTSNHVRLAIYDELSGSPNNLLWECDSASVSFGWNNIAVSTGLFRNNWIGNVSGSQGYWLMWQCDFSGTNALGPSLTVTSQNIGIYSYQDYAAFPSTWSGGTSNVNKWSQYTYTSTPMLLIPSMASHNISNTVSILRTFFKTLSTTLVNSVFSTPYNYFYTYLTQDLSFTGSASQMFRAVKSLTGSITNNSISQYLQALLRSATQNLANSVDTSFFKGPMRILTATLGNAAETPSLAMIYLRSLAQNIVNLFSSYTLAPPFEIVLEEHK